jgi:predicted phosphodiesterase
MFKVVGPLDPEKDHFVGRVQELTQMRKWVKSAETYGLVLGASQTGKTSLLLKLQADLQSETEYACVYLNLQPFSDLDQSQVYLHLSEKIAEKLSSRLEKEEWPQASDGLAFIHFLKQISEKIDSSRIVLLLDEMGALSQQSLGSLAGTIRGIFINRLEEHELQKFVFIYAAGTDVLTLAEKRGSPLRNITECAYLEDLSRSETFQVLEYGFAQEGIQIEEAIADHIYGWTHGHPYLTQALGDMLVMTKQQRGDSLLTKTSVDKAVQSLHKKGDSNLRHIVNALGRARKDPPVLLEKVRDILESRVKIRFSRTDPETLQLELIGVVREDEDGYCIIRNWIYQQILQNHLQPKAPEDNGKAPVVIQPETPDETGKASAVILHLSDIQFGRHHVDKEKRPPLYDGEQAYDDQLAKLKADLKRLEEWVDKPHLIVVSGDLAEWGEETEFQKVEAFLDGLVQHCKLLRSRVVMTPGNHDINRDLCAGARLDAKARHREFRPPYFQKFEFYQNFFNRFYRSDPRDPNPLNAPEFTEELFVVYSYPELGILIASLNSCVQESELPEDHYGWVSVDQMTRAVQRCDEIDPERKMLRIAVMHHNFQGDSDCDNENLRDADDIRYALLKGGFRLLLHGHQHKPKAEVSGHPGLFLHVLATGSAGLDGEVIPDNARRYQVIVIAGEKVKVYCKRFDEQKSDETGTGCWVPDLGPEDFGAGKGSVTMEFSLSLNK